MNNQEAIKLLKDAREDCTSGEDEPYKEALGMAIIALDKQIPQKVKGISITHDGVVGNCPSCGKFIRYRENKVCCHNEDCLMRLDWGARMNKQEIESVINTLSYLVGYEKTVREDSEFGESKLELDELEALEKAVEHLQQQLTGGWILVSERLPEEKISPITHDYYDYECTFTTDNVTEVRHYKFGGGHWWHGSGCVDEYITAWRERPEPWKGEQG